MINKVGDVLAWKREGNDEALRCEVLQVRNGVNLRAQLRIEGWFGTQWETLDSNFEVYAEWEARQQAKAAEKRATAKKLKAAA